MRRTTWPVGAMLGAVNPPQFLQDITVYTGSGLAACFLGPMVFAPDANQGPLLGLFITGPAGAVIGAVMGFVIWRSGRARD